MEESIVQQNASQQINLHDVVKLENQLNGGANWFFWIAGLSLVNSLTYLFGGGLTFVVGLGMTQLVDGFVSAIIAQIVPEAVSVVKIIGFALVTFLAGIMALFGILGRKRHQWAFILGMVLYGLDGLIFLLVRDIFSLGFHVLALFWIWKGLQALKKLNAINNGEVVIANELLPKPKQTRDRKYWERLIWLAAILLIPLFIFLIMFFLSY
ncbi:MAG: hypothetical protein KC443_00985 [Anaerolineales bacterium]|nr:hypothetical protein [Anaerolineales bacterium]